MTLVASNKSLTVGHIAGVERFCNQQGIAVIGAPEWLYRHHAADLPIASCLTHAQMEILWDALQTDRIDVFCTPADGRRKQLLLGGHGCHDCDHGNAGRTCRTCGHQQKNSAITTRAMNGEIDFHGALIERVALLKGLPETVLTKTLGETSLSLGVDMLMSTLNKHRVQRIGFWGIYIFYWRHFPPGGFYRTSWECAGN